MKKQFQTACLIVTSFGIAKAIMGNLIAVKWQYALLFIAFLLFVDALIKYPIDKYVLRLFRPDHIKRSDVAINAQNLILSGFSAVFLTYAGVALDIKEVKLSLDQLQIATTQEQLFPLLIFICFMGVSVELIDVLFQYIRIKLQKNDIHNIQ